ncbi:23S rRNA (adenine(2503)-C(2))-methyltransferase RlmN [Blastopirellula marina]|uniref:Radical SAM protein n=1 Tax=Blastopirellula marina TaxID=124 RepID=A0A2S8GRD2_9BACT|nr:23S rRNA (adenine(2503)-C(2))-methyltransferase RlmN [Blastopirellula marina]PQO46931.1 radical SAM protein [Blastopirellula marina]
MRSSIHDEAAVESLRKRLALDPHRVRRLWNRLVKLQGSQEEALLELPAEARDAFAAEIRFHELTLDQRFDSQVDGASKLLFRTDDGLLLESVILRVATGRTALCVSSQVGCAANCDFCATGKMGIARSLSAPQILDQVVQANQLLKPEGRKVRNIVFMGMGEPFHNVAAVHATLEKLVSPLGFDQSPRRTLVSTVGLPGAMVEFARKFPGVNLALSLHSAIQSRREEIIPLAAKYDLQELRAALEEVAAIGEQSIMIEYLMLRGINDGPEDRAALADYLRGLPVHINLIPYNRVEAAPHLEGTSKEEREAFGAALRAEGYTVTIRYSLGADVDAACGQLVRRENRRIAAAAAAAQ